MTGLVNGQLKQLTCYGFVLKVVGSLKSESTRRVVGTQQGYLFQANIVLCHKTSQQAHARLVNYTLTSVTLALHGLCQTSHTTSVELQ